MYLLWFKKSTGLDAKIDPVRHGYKEEDGVTSLEIGYNIQHDRTGRISMRKGYEATDVTADCHSLFCDGGDCCFVTGDALCLLNSDFSYKELRNVTPGNKMAYCQVGDRVYYTNGVEKGFVLGGLSYGWEKPSVVYGQQDSTRVKTGPPIGSLIAYYNDRAYVAQGNYLWGSDRGATTVFDPIAGRLGFESNITFVMPVKEGIYVGTERSVAFLRGNSYHDFRYERKRTYGAITGTAIYAEAELIPVVEGVQDVGILCTSSGGVLYGTSQGDIINLTRYKLKMPEALFGAAVKINEDYIVCLEPRSADFGVTLCLQLESLALSQFGSYNFNSMCKFGREHIGANSSGIFKLGKNDKDDTTSISSIVKLAPTNFGSVWPKRLGTYKVALEGEGRFKITFIANERTDKKVVEVLTPYYEDNSQHIIEGNVGRDLIGQYWAAEIRNLDGNDFSVDSIVIDVQELKQRVRGIKDA